ncbi:High-affinity nitrate transporter 3.1 [Hibiscus syriacus]|uniref:High-affinity nitrate transporter 3.1 n=2 Tax=Hibiscus syriacus TaxID=106335 RepID=A0A6A3CS09_HIBSY|nr:High-affinity nitrate transporter 3.1 [Hibiscus syriacus]
MREKPTTFAFVRFGSMVEAQRAVAEGIRRIMDGFHVRAFYARSSTGMQPKSSSNSGVLKTFKPGWRDREVLIVSSKPVQALTQLVPANISRRVKIWVLLEDVPLLVWDKFFFKELTCRWREVRQINEETLNLKRFDRAKDLMSVQNVSKIPGSASILVNRTLRLFNRHLQGKSMAGGALFLGLVLVLAYFSETCFAMITFSSLQRTLVVTASHPQRILKAGEDKITVTWGLNQSLPAGTDSAYRTIKVQLCYAPISQVDRAWRKTVDNLSKDKTCQFKILKGPYTTTNRTSEWTIERDVPAATYFIRAYALDDDDRQVAYGQTNDAKKSTNLIEIQAISGRHVSLDIASVCFSVFSIVALTGFFVTEKIKGRKAQQ